ncbi:hypothetical protein PIB30_059587 [Stylosanthes scabra]|uniref:DUF4216 domain-containing protein n=1 Tax=Stylosanthes scabra TaxID=79078 RepID=A0ABU6UJ24_9FABA|nr:hypothetical protein [Stylosanthes scabra]
MERPRSWMYDRVHTNRWGLKPSFINGLDEFLSHCMSLENYVRFGKVTLARVNVTELEYLGEPKNRAVLFKCEWYDPARPRGTRTHKDYQITEVNHSRRIEAEEVLVQEEAYQNTEKISVRLINKIEIPQTLTSLDGEVDIVNTQPPHTESDDEGAVDGGSSDDNESASAESISTEDDE